MILITLPDGTLINIDIAMAAFFVIAFLLAFGFSLNKVLGHYLKKD